MVIISIKGGLGNQLFQYAAGYALSKRLGQDFAIDNTFFPHQTLRGYKLGSLCIDAEVFYKEETIDLHIMKNRYVQALRRKLHRTIGHCSNNTTYLLETKSTIISEFFQDFSGNVYVDGYFQSERYFKEYRVDILRQFIPAYKPEQEYMDVLEQIQSCNAVAVHVRRGDFLKAQNDRNPNHYLLGEQYYRNSLNYMQQQLDKPVFFWFSDDIDWVKQNFGEKENFYFVSLKTKHGDIDEMMLMKNCHHIIAANSTFSWWASWMNEHEDAIHVCPAKRYGNLHMIPDGWIKISVE